MAPPLCKCKTQRDKTHMSQECRNGPLSKIPQIDRMEDGNDTT